MIDVIIPTLRPDKIEVFIDSIERNFVYDHNIYVICPEKGFKDTIAKYSSECIFLIEKVPLGVVNAVNMATFYSKGEYITTFSDECTVNYRYDEFMIERIKDKFAIGMPESVPYYDFKYYGYTYSPFPFISRETLDKLYGIFFNPMYGSFYADPDLSFRVLLSGGEVVMSEKSICYHHNNLDDVHHKNNLSKYLSKDKENFERFWDLHKKTLDSMHVLKDD